MTRREERRLLICFVVSALSFDALMAYTLLSVITRAAPLLGYGATL